MSWDPWVQEEIGGLREDLERRSYEAHLRRNPDEREKIDDVVMRARVEAIRNAQAFNEFVPQAVAAQQVVVEMREN